jgi:hypothetical protein
MKFVFFSKPTAYVTVTLRLLNACDIWWHRMLRFLPDKEKRIRETSRRDTSIMRDALGNFEEYMEPFLPTQNLLPPPEDNE